jgi:hypothetical protein
MLINAREFFIDGRQGGLGLNFLRLRIARELYWNLRYYLNYDSRPPSNIPQTDYGLSSGLGWTY